jgi:hypothetical protein
MKFCSRNPEEGRDHSEDVDVDGKITLEFIFDK